MTQQITGFCFHDGDVTYFVDVYYDPQTEAMTGIAHLSYGRENPNGPSVGVEVAPKHFARFQAKFAEEISEGFEMVKRDCWYSPSVGCLRDW